MLHVNQVRQGSVLERGLGKVNSKLKSNPVWGKNVQQAVTIGIWVAIVGLPIYTKIPRRYFFGVEKCGDISGFGFVNVKGNESYVSHFKNQRGEWTGESPGYDDLEGRGQIWCGLLPRAYSKAWPQIASTMIYQVRKDTGSTVQSFYVVFVGVFWAALNLEILGFLFPDGPRGMGLFEEAFVWADIMLCIVAATISTADIWTRKFFLVYHCSFMMTFLQQGKPHGSNRTMLFRGLDEVTVKVFIILLLSAVCSVLTTIIPQPLLNIRSVQEDSKSSVQAAESLFREGCIHFGNKVQTMKGKQIEAKAFGFREKAECVRSNLELSWWETLDFGNSQRVRHLYMFLEEKMCGVRAQFAMLDLGTDVKNMTFDVDIKGTIAEQLSNPLNELREATAQLLDICCECCKDGLIDDDEILELQDEEIKVKQYQKELLDAYRACLEKLHPEPGPGAVRDEVAFISAVSRWADQVVDLSHDLRLWKPKEPEGAVKNLEYIKEALLVRCKGAFAQNQMTRSHVTIAVRNSLALIGIFCVGRFVSWGNLFTKFNPFMPVSLSLLMNEKAGTQVKAGFNRMLGITLGNLIPMLCVAGLTEESLMAIPLLRVPLHFMMIVIYTSIFAYLAYSSKTYDMVGLFSAGFGMSRVFGTCAMFEHEIGSTVEGLSDNEMTEGYKSLLLLSVVLVWQSVTGAIGALFQTKDTRKDAIKAMEKIGEACNSGLEAFLAGKGAQGKSMAAFEKELDESVQEMREAVQRARQFPPLLQPSAEVAPGCRTGFKVDLYEKALRPIESVVASFQTLVEVSKNQGTGEFMNTLRTNTDWPDFQGEVRTHVKDCFDILIEVLSQETETETPSDQLAEAEQKLQKVDTDAGEPFKDLISRRIKDANGDVQGLHQEHSARLLTASASLHNILSLALLIEAECVVAHVC